MNYLYHGDCMELLEVHPPVKAIFMDPPDNIGLEYSSFRDRIEDYYGWIERLLLRAVLKAEVIWLSYNHVHDLEIKHSIRQILRHRHPSWSCREFLWTYTFSQYTEKDCAQSFRPIVRLTKPGCQLYPDAIRIASERMLIGDTRAAGPKVPNCVWEFPRVVGNSAERRSWHPTQHPEKLIQRMMLFSCSPHERWLDCFAGSGTSFRVKAMCEVTGCEISEDYCQRLSEEHRLPISGIGELALKSNQG